MAKPPPDVDPSAITRLWTSIQPYDWGSREFIARLQGRPVPSDGPEAELWIGDHPRAPSYIGRDASVSLRDHIAAHPLATLGRETNERFGARLPFLAKVLAAARPLSLQVHPDAAQAKAGFETEEEARIPMSARERTYSDPDRKIELMIAIEPFSALCGFRDSDSLESLLGESEFPTIRRLQQESGPTKSASGDLFFRLRGLDAADHASVLKELGRFAGHKAGALPEAEWIGKLLELYPGDIGACAPLLLNLVLMRPGEGLFVRPGVLHSYLGGNGFEVMSSSDNVVRGGLTSKYVDQVALEAIVQREPGPPDVVAPHEEEAGIERYVLGARGVDEFEVSMISVGADGHPSVVCRRSSVKPSVLFCATGSVTIETTAEPAETRTLELAAGNAVWIPAAEGDLRICAREFSRLFAVSVP
jgi:mannose-6-phosphate isomerase